MRKKIFAAIVICLFSLAACAQSNQAEQAEPPMPEETPAEALAVQKTQLEFPQLLPMVEGEDIAIITTNFGDIKVRFFQNEAPKAVENFITHAKNGYYDGLIFHRVIEGFMLQGGDPEGTGTGGESIWGTPFEDEVTPALRNFRGALSMANSGVNTNGSQFFIVQNNSLAETAREDLAEVLEHQDEVIGTLEDGTEVTIGELYPTEAIQKYLSDGGAYWLDFRHTVFGQVYEGMDVVDKIAAVETTGGEENRPLEDVIIEGIKIEKY